MTDVYAKTEYGNVKVMFHDATHATVSLDELAVNRIPVRGTLYMEYRPGYTGLGWHPRDGYIKRGSGWDDVTSNMRSKLYDMVRSLVPTLATPDVLRLAELHSMEASADRKVAEAEKLEADAARLRNDAATLLAAAAEMRKES